MSDQPFKAETGPLADTINELAVMETCARALFELDHRARARVFYWLENAIENAATDDRQHYADTVQELDAVRTRTVVLSKVTAALLSGYPEQAQRWLDELPEDERPRLFDIKQTDGGPMLVTREQQLENNTDEATTNNDDANHPDDDVGF